MAKSDCVYVRMKQEMKKENHYEWARWKALEKFQFLKKWILLAIE